MPALEALSRPFEAADHWLAGLLSGAPLLLSVAVAFLLGLRHASDPDHLVAVTSLVAAEGGDVRAAARLESSWGLGHALTLLAVGLPLIALEASVPGALERGAEVGIGAVIVLLAARVLVRWRRGAAGEPRRTPHQAFAIGTLHGLAGTGAVVLLLVAALPGRLEAAAALAVFAPMSVVSMTACTIAFAWTLTRPVLALLYRRAVIPALGGFGLVFGLWYAGLV